MRINFAKYWIGFFLCIASLGCSASFEEEMGKGTPCWKFVQTKEDQEKILFFSTLFQKQMALLKEKKAGYQIPPIVHFVWLGPAAFPKSSEVYLARWMKKHPDWVFKFWTDVERDPPLKGMQKCRVADFCFRFLQDEYDHSMNFGEKAKILAYEILFAEGGVYADHDTYPLVSLAPLHAHFDFYCGLEPLAPSIMSSSVIPSTHLFGAKAEHPVIGQALLFLKTHWYSLEKNYPGETKTAISNRICHRTFAALAEGIDKKLNQEANKDIVFPTTYFSGKKECANAFALHDHQKKWIEGPSAFEKKFQKQFQEMIVKSNRLLIVNLFLILCSLCCVGTCVHLFKQRKKNG